MDQYVLRGNTALIACYNLPEIPKDICFDGRDRNLILNIVEKFVREKNFSYYIAKKDSSKTEIIINYGEGQINIEVLHSIPKKNACTYINDIHVYDIDIIAMLTAEAYLWRESLSDLIDLVFMFTKMREKISDFSIGLIADAVSRKKIEQFDFWVRFEPETNLDLVQLKRDFLEMCRLLNIKDEN